MKSTKKQVTIGKKIGGGFAVVLLLTASVIGIYQFALSSSSHELTEILEHEVNMAMRVSAATTALGNCRRFEKDFLLTNGQEGYLKKQRNSMAEFEDELDTVIALAEKAEMPDIVKSSENIVTLFATYQKAFETMATAPETERMSLKAPVSSAAHAIEAELEKLLNNAKDIYAQESTLAKQQSTFLGFLALGLGVVVMIIGSVLAFILGRGISTTLKNVSVSLNDAAEQVSAAAGEVSSSSQTLAEGASQQAAAVEETSASLEEVGAMIHQGADNARQADELMKEAGEVIRDADASMKKLIVSMQEISATSGQTQKIVKTIDEIAFQTNLLALNAAVEAARAGEAGAGFAVVADEVRNLAMRAAAAAKNTSDLIEGTVQSINAGSALAKETGESFYIATQATTRIGTIVTEMAGAAEQQASAVGQIVKAIHEIDTVTQSNAATAEESASASEELNAQAEMMKGQIGNLRKMVEG